MLKMRFAAFSSLHLQMDVGVNERLFFFNML